LGQPHQVSSKYVGKRLLIVDDDADMRLLLAEYFRRLGFHVEERESGAAALEPATIGRFDCFIFDVSMPGMTGFELLKRVRDRGVQTPALFLTAHDALDYKVPGYEAGGNDYLARNCGVAVYAPPFEEAIMRYLDTTNVQPKPFIWTKTPDQILASIARFCKRISDSVH